MSLLFCDGFDNYGSIDNMMRGRWFGIDEFTTFRAGRFNGKSAVIAGGSLAVGANLSYGVLGFAFKEDGGGASYSHAVKYVSIGGTRESCVKVVFDASSGTVVIYTYAPYEWTQRAASLPGLFTNLTWCYVEIKVDAASGVVVRINGSTVVTYSASLAATESAGSFNTIIIEPGGTGSNLLWVDDLYMLDSEVGPGSRPMTDFLGDKRVMTMFPASNDSTQWTPAASIEYLHGGVTWDYMTISANRVYLPRYVSTSYLSSGTVRSDKSAIIAKQDGALSSITLKSQGSVPGVHIRPLLYSEDPVNPDHARTLVAIGDETTGLTPGLNVIPFGSTAPSMTKGTRYWIGFIADAGFSAAFAINVGGWSYSAATYPSAPSEFPWSTAVSLDNSIILDYTVTATNYGMVQEDDADAISYNTTSTLNNQDLFGIGPPMAISATVYAVQVSGSYKKDDANARSVANLIKSGSVQAQGGDFALNADYKYVSDVFVLNPETGSEWTVEQANAAKVGYKVTV